MRTVTITGFVYTTKRTNYSTGKTEPVYSFYMSKGLDPDCFGLMVGPVSFEYTIPDGFNAVAVEVAALEKKLKDSDDEHMRARNAILTRLSKLQAIGCEVA